MYNLIKEIKSEEKLKDNKKNDKILGMAIMMFISFSILNVFLIFNFIDILNTI